MIEAEALGGSTEGGVAAVIYNALRMHFDGGVWKSEEVPIFQALGRYLAEEIIAEEDLSEYGFAAGTVSFEEGRRLSASDIGILAAMGKVCVSVWCRPYVSVLTTGENLVTPFEVPDEQQLRDSGSFLLSALLEETGAQALSVDMICEGQQAVEEGIRRALVASDIVIVARSPEVCEATGMKDSEEEAFLSIMKSLGRPGVIAVAPVTEGGSKTILSAVKDEFCHCAGRMPALVICLPGNPGGLAEHYEKTVDYFIRRYYFHNQ